MHIHSVTNRGVRASALVGESPPAGWRVGGRVAANGRVLVGTGVWGRVGGRAGARWDGRNTAPPRSALEADTGPVLVSQAGTLAAEP